MLLVNPLVALRRCFFLDLISWRYAQTKAGVILQFHQQPIRSGLRHLRSAHQSFKLVKGNGAREIFTTIAPVVQQGDADLVDLLDENPGTTADPAAHGPAFFWFGLFRLGAALLVQHGPFINDAIFVMKNPAADAGNDLLIVGQGNGLRLHRRNDAAFQRRPKPHLSFVLGCRLVARVVFERVTLGVIRPVGNVHRHLQTQVIGLPRFAILLGLGSDASLCAHFGFQDLDTACTNIGTLLVFGMTYRAGGALFPIF